MNKLTTTCLLAVGLVATRAGTSIVLAHDGHEHNASPSAVVPNNSPPPLRSIPPQFDNSENRISPAAPFRRVPRTMLPPRDAGNAPVRGNLNDRPSAWRPNVTQSFDTWNSSPRVERPPLPLNDSTWRRANDFNPVRPKARRRLDRPWTGNSEDRRCNCQCDEADFSLSNSDASIRSTDWCQSVVANIHAMAATLRTQQLQLDCPRQL